jgi:hypothetical protein
MVIVFILLVSLAPLPSFFSPSSSSKMYCVMFVPSKLVMWKKNEL